MKAIRLPDGLTATRIEQMLDACESAARVRNPGWVTPSVAAIQNRHFVMVRPWIFAVAWLPAIATQTVSTQLNELASLAYTLEAAHQTGATHGGLNANNLLLDHDGTLRVVDATCNHNAIQSWINPSLMTPNESTVLSKSERQKLDLDDLIRLISSHVANWQQPWTYRLIGELGRVSESSDPGSAADLGDLLMRYADSPARSCFIKKSTRGFWKNWLGKP